MDKDELLREKEYTENPPEEPQRARPAKVFLYLALILILLPLIIYAIDSFYLKPMFLRGWRSTEGCSRARQDANSVLAALASYFSDPENMRIPSINTLRRTADISLHNENPEPTIWPPEGSNAYHYNSIQVTVNDNSGQCFHGSDYIAAGNVFMPDQHAGMAHYGGYWE